MIKLDDMEKVVKAIKAYNDVAYNVKCSMCKLGQNLSVYTQTLYNMVQRHLTIIHKFICYTNHIKLQKIIKEDNFEIRKLPFCEEYQGYWNKLSLFRSKTNGHLFIL